MAQAFDLVQSEYGWTDDVLLDLPVRRLRQITAAITDRLNIRERVNQGYIEWHARTVSAFVASASGSKELVKAVSDIEMFSRTPENVGAVGDRDVEEWLEKGAEVDPQKGSFERLMRSMQGG